MSIIRNKEDPYVILRINPTGYNKCKYLCTQHRITQIYRININRLKGRNGQQYNNSGDFNAPFYAMEDKIEKQSGNMGLK